MRRALRIVVWGVAAALALGTLLIAALLIAGNTAGGRHFIEQLTGRLTGGTVRLVGLGGSLPLAPELERLELRDQRGVWLTAEKLRVRWSPQALLGRRIWIHDLRATRVDIERAPVSEPPDSAVAPASPRLPHIDADRLSIDVLALGAALAGHAAELTVQGKLRLVSLSEATAALSAHRIDGENDRYQLSLALDPQHISASVAVDEQAGGVLQNLSQLPYLGALHLEGRMDGPRSGAPLQLVARAGELRAEARGTADLTHRSADLEVRAHSPAMRPRPDLSWQRIDFTARSHGAWSAPDATAELTALDLEVPGDIAAAALNANLREHAGVLSVQADAERLTLPGSYAGLLRDAPLHADGSVRLADPQRSWLLNVRHPLFVLSAQAADTASPGAAFDLRIADAAPLAALIGQKVHGGAMLRGTLLQEGAATRLDAEAVASLQEATLLTHLLGRSPRVRVSATFAQSVINLARLDLTAAAGSLAASGTLGLRPGDGATAPAPDLRAQWRLNVPDLRAVSPALAGAMTLTGQASGTLRSFAADIQASADLSMHGSALGAIHASLRARDLPHSPSGAVTVQGMLDGEPLSLDVSAERRRDQSFQLTIDRANWRSARAAGALTVAQPLAGSSGTLHLEMGHLGDLDRLLGEKLAGSVAGELALTQAHGRSAVRLELKAHEVAAAGIVGDASLVASGPLDSPTLHLTAQLPDLNGAPAAASATAQLNVASRTLHLTELKATYHHESPHLLAPADLSFAEGVQVTGLKIGLHQAVISADGSIAPRLELTAAAHGIDPAVVNAFLPGLLGQGLISAAAELSGTPSAPLGHVSLSATNLRLADSAVRDLPPAAIHVSAELHGSSAQVNAQLEGGSGGRLTLTGEAPLNKSGGYALKLVGNLDLTLANALLESNGAHASGTLSADLTVSGAAAAPQIDGTLRLARADLRDYRLGLHLSDINGTLTGSHGTLEINQLSARAAPGQVTVSGTVGILQPKIPIDLHINAENATPIASDILTARLDAQLRFQGTLESRSDLSGSIFIRRADINIPNTFPPDVAVLDVRRRGQAPQPAVKPRLAIGLNLTLDAPRQILVQGRGLSAELGGELQIRGTTDAPRVRGGFDLIRGRFALGSTTLNFTAGRVGFESAGLKSKIDPSLDFTAQTSAPDATATLRVTGFADAPQFALSSSPPLPQDEIMARLLFGQSASGLSSMQAAQLGHALATLSGLGGNIDLLAKLQKTLGLDTLALGSVTTGTGSSQSSSVSVVAGRYISDRVLVTGKESEYGTQLGVEVELSKHFKLTTQLGNNNVSAQNVTPDNDPGSTIGISYQFEY